MPKARGFCSNASTNNKVSGYHGAWWHQDAAAPIKKHPNLVVYTSLEMRISSIETSEQTRVLHLVEVGCILQVRVSFFLCVCVSCVCVCACVFVCDAVIFALIR